MDIDKDITRKIVTFPKETLLFLNVEVGPILCVMWAQIVTVGALEHCSISQNESLHAWNQ